MGEYADLIIEGAHCQDCGTFIDGEAPGYPRSCKLCKPRPAAKKTKCPTCGKLVKATGLADHTLDAHGVKP